MLESEIQRQIVKYLKDNNYFYFKIQSASVNGIPDIFTIINNKAIFIEVKTLNGKLSPLQEYQIKRINESGLIAIVVRSLSELIEFKDKLTK